MYVSVGDVKMVLRLRNLKKQASAEQDPQRLSWVDESVLFGIQVPFQLGMHRPLSEEDGEAEVRSHLMSCENGADSVRSAHF
jgi:hypothetical protein